MDASNEQVQSTELDSTSPNPVPAGNHPLEIAARDGFGPLSPAGGEIWHGNATPCVTCGQLVPREARHCHSCGQDLRPAMLAKMRAHAGPWYVLEHLRPFPGVNLERIVKQIRRGLITETSIVRGPATLYQWRFALETPGLCRYFGKCWHCFSQVGQSETACQQCGAHLTFEPARTGALASGMAAMAPGRAAMTRPGSSLSNAMQTAPPSGFSLGSAGISAPHDAAISALSSNELDRLRAALNDAPAPGTRLDQPARIAGIRVSWIAAGLVILAVVALLVVASMRDKTPAPATPMKTPTPAVSK